MTLLTDELRRALMDFIGREIFDHGMSCALVPGGSCDARRAPPIDLAIDLPMELIQGRLHRARVLCQGAAVGQHQHEGQSMIVRRRLSTAICAARLALRKIKKLATLRLVL